MTDSSTPVSTNTNEAKNKARGFLTTLSGTLQDFTEVRVFTIVGQVKVEFKPTAGGKTTETTIVEGETIEDGALVSIVKLLDGDVTTIIPEKYRDDDKIQALHSAQVAESVKVLPANLTLLVDTVKSILDVND